MAEVSEKYDQDDAEIKASVKLLIEKSRDAVQ